MGYSSRYHAASLAAVFVALAVGILIGAALGSDVITGTAENLEQGLGEDLDRLRSENSDLRGELEAERAFQGQIYPAVVGGRLGGVGVALVALGDVDTTALAAEVTAALEPAGAELVEVAEVRQPPDTDAVVAALRPGARRALPRGAALGRAARRVGERLLAGGELGPAREAMFTSYSGTTSGIEAAVVVRAEPGEWSPREAADAETLEQGLLDGMSQSGRRLVGAERGGDEPSQIAFFAERGISSVDNLDTVAGKVALVLALDGAEGAFGTKESADGLLPDLLTGDAAAP